MWMSKPFTDVLMNCARPFKHHTFRLVIITYHHHSDIQITLVIKKMLNIG